jgi:hypothetical protein
VVLDSYSLFDKKISGEWQIIGRQDDYVPVGYEKIFFSYGVGDSCKRVSVNGDVQSIMQGEKNKYPPYAPRNDNHIQALFESGQI